VESREFGVHFSVEPIFARWYHPDMDMKRDEMLRALMEKDATCDGLFYAGVT
jgi:hypothetical protein